MAEKVKLSTDEAVKEIKQLIIELKLLDKTLGKMSTGNVAAFNKMASSMGGFKSKITELNNSIKRLGDLTKTNSKRLTRNSNEIKRNSDLTKTNSKNKRQNTTATNKNTRALLGEAKATNKSTVAKKKNSSAMGGMMKGFKGLLGALGLVGVIATIGKALLSIASLTIKFQSLGFAMEKISKGNMAEVKRSMEFLIELNDKFGAKISVTAERWLKFRAAAMASNISLKETMGIFRSVTKASSVLGLRTDELKGVYLALEQMLSKGKVTTEELRRQLGERLPGAMGIMAKAVGVSVSQLDKMLKKGEVLSSTALPKFAKELEKAYGIDSLESVDNLATGVGKLSGAWDRFVLTITEGDSAITTIIGGTMSLITLGINSLTNFLETFEQTANRTSGALFGDIATKTLSDRIEARLKLAGVLEKTEQQLLDEVKALEIIQAATESESDERLKATENVLKKEKELSDLRKQKAEEGHLYAIQQMEDQTKIKDALEKATQAALDELNAEKLKDSNRQASALTGLGTANTGMEKGSSIEIDKKTKAYEELNAQYTLQLELWKQTNELLISSNGGSLEPDSDASQKKIKLAKEFIGTNKFLINTLKERVRLNKELAKDEEFGIVKRIDMSFENAENLQRIAELEKEDRIEANKLWLRNEDIKLEENLTKHKGNAEALAKQEEENNKQREYNQIEFKEKEALINQQYSEQLQKNLEQGGVEWEKIQTDKFIVKKDLLNTELQEEIRVINLKLANTRKGSNEESKLLLELADLKVKIQNELILLEVDELERQLKYVKSLDEEKKLLQEIRDLKAGIKTKPSEDFNVTSTGNGEGGAIIDPEKAGDAVELINGAQNTANELISIADQVFQNRIDNIQREIDEETEKYDRLLELAKNDEEETKIIERNKALRLKELNRKKAIEQEKQAKLDKALRISQAVSSTATAIIMALAQPAQPTWLSIANAGLVAAAGAAQIATIVATPIPQFAEGGIMEYDGKAQINDGGRQEYVERNGQLLTSSQTNAVVDLKKGDIIHKDFETLQKQSMLLSLTSGGEKVSEKDFNLAFGIKEEIKAGFNKAKVNSNVTVLNETNSYRDKMSMWD